MKDRITGLRRVPAAELRENPKNWRTHPPEQRTALAAALDSIGLVDAVIARDTPDGLELVDGHLRADLAGDADIPVLVVDLDDSEAAAALATLDPIAAMAAADTPALRRLLEDVETPAADLIPWRSLYGPRADGLPTASSGAIPPDQIRPPVRIYGSKVSGAKFITAALPDDLGVYVEPYAGTLSVLLARPKARTEIVNDLDGHAVAFWRAVRDHTAELARRCAATPSARDELAACRAALAAGGFTDPVEHARCFAVAAQQSLYSQAPNPAFSPATAKGTWRRHFSTGGGADWERTRTADWQTLADRLDSVQIDNTDGVKVIDAAPPGAVVYCDPPYQRSSNTSSYEHTVDPAEVEDAALRAAARGCLVAVSGYAGDWPLLHEAWHQIRWTAKCGPAGTLQQIRTEVLTTSYEPDADRLAAADPDLRAEPPP